MKTPYIRNNDEARFWSKVDKNGPILRPDLGPCWKWLTFIDRAGYAPFRARGPIKANSAHVYSFILHKGPIPAGHEVDHICRNRGCCNPDHLRPLTHRDNVLCGDTIPGRNAVKSHCLRGHELTPENIYVNSRGERQCRACVRARGRDASWKSHGMMRSGPAKLTDEQVREIHSRHLSGERRESIAQSFGISYSAIEKILRGVRWPNIHAEFKAPQQLQFSAA